MQTALQTYSIRMVTGQPLVSQHATGSTGVKIQNVIHVYIPEHVSLLEGILCFEHIYFEVCVCGVVCNMCRK